MDYFTAKQMAERWGITPNRVTILCKNGRIPQAMQIGTQWMIPCNTEKPADGRRRQAKAGKKTDFFRFPLYLNFPENSFMPPLSEDEKLLRQAQIDFFACEFDRAEEVFAALANRAESVHIRIAALAFGCINSTHSGNGTEFPGLFARLNGELAADFPHKREAELFLLWIYCFLAEYKTVSEELKLMPEYDYSADCLPFIGVLGFSYLLQLDPKSSFVPNWAMYELQCRQAELNGNFYEAQEMHFSLFFCYYLTHNRESMVYHLQKGLRLAQEHNLFLIAACYAVFCPADFNKVLAEFPAEFSEKIHRVGNMIQKSYGRFVGRNENINIFTALSPNDYQFALYAAMGYTNRQVAGILKKSEKTVVNRYNEIYEKLGISGKRELVAMITNF